MNEQANDKKIARDLLSEGVLLFLQRSFHSKAHHRKLLTISEIIRKLSKFVELPHEKLGIFEILNLLVFHQDPAIFLNALASYDALLPNFGRCDLHFTMNFSLMPSLVFIFYKERKEWDQEIFDGAIRSWEKEISLTIPNVLKDVIHGYFMLFDDANVTKLQNPNAIKRMVDGLDHKNDQPMIIKTFGSLCSSHTHFPFADIDETDDYGMRYLLSKLVDDRYLEHPNTDIRLNVYALLSRIMIDSNVEQCFDIMSDAGIYEPWVRFLDCYALTDEYDEIGKALIFDVIKRVMRWSEHEVFDELAKQKVHRSFFKMLFAYFECLDSSDYDYSEQGQQIRFMIDDLFCIIDEQDIEDVHDIAFDFMRCMNVERFLRFKHHMLPLLCAINDSLEENMHGSHALDGDKMIEVAHDAAGRCIRQEHTSDVGVNTLV